METVANWSAHSARCVALIPAAGSGRRMGESGVPKQYLSLAGKPLIWHSVAALYGTAMIERIYVVLAPADERWSAIELAPFAEKLSVLRCGGSTRAESVANGLREITCDCDSEAVHVLVHDAARPCLTRELIESLIATGLNHADGAILALPLADTLKRATPGADPTIAATVSRELLWQAQTPQMFRLGPLLRALIAAPAVTDEASAMEACGAHPRLVPGDPSNLKVTYARDLELAAQILASRSAAQLEPVT